MRSVLQGSIQLLFRRVKGFNSLSERQIPSLGFCPAFSRFSSNQSMFQCITPSFLMQTGVTGQAGGRPVYRQRSPLAWSFCTAMMRVLPTGYACVQLFLLRSEAALRFMLPITSVPAAAAMMMQMHSTIMDSAAECSGSGGLCKSASSGIPSLPDLCVVFFRRLAFTAGSSADEITADESGEHRAGIQHCACTARLSSGVWK